MKGRISRVAVDVNYTLLPRVGVLKIGCKNERGHPQSVDYFIPSGKYAALFTKAYGDRPSSIQIVFPEDDPAKVCNEMYEYRDDDGKRVAYGDGETFRVWNGNKYDTYLASTYPRLMEGIAEKNPNKAVRSGGDGWSITLTLTFIAPLVRGVAGVWQFVTKGTASTIPSIRNTFDAVLAQKGFVKGLIFDLNVEFVKSQAPGVKSRYPVVQLVPNESTENVNRVRPELALKE